MTQRPLRLLAAEDVESRLAALSNRDCAMAIVAVCRAAIRCAGFDHPVLGIALATLERGEAVANDLRSQIAGLVEFADRTYFENKDRFEHGQIEERVYLESFRAARAANAVLFCIDAESPDAAAEAIYEAAHAMDGVAAVRKVLETSETGT